MDDHTRLFIINQDLKRVKKDIAMLEIKRKVLEKEKIKYEKASG